MYELCNLINRLELITSHPDVRDFRKVKSLLDDLLSGRALTGEIPKDILE